MTGNHQRPALVFDFGGVLVDWNPRHLYRRLFHGDEAAVENFLTEIGFVPWNLAMDRGRPFAESVAELSARFPQYADLIRAYDTRWEESVPGAIEPTVELLAQLKRAGYPLFGLSNWSSEKFALVRHKYLFLAWFDAYLISGDVKIIKPDPRIYQLLLEKIGKPAAQCIFIDDAATNITAARELGFDAIQFHDAAQLAAALTHRGLAF